ncbi:MAG: hypothetical protein FWF57_01400 [Defluviitaleaceae bacterium]|nr:hypothetical protein [Defluviitaleaceae bacterium]
MAKGLIVEFFKSVIQNFLCIRGAVAFFMDIPLILMATTQVEPNYNISIWIPIFMTIITTAGSIIVAVINSKSKNKNDKIFIKNDEAIMEKISGTKEILEKDHQSIKDKITSVSKPIGKNVSEIRDTMLEEKNRRINLYKNADISIKELSLSLQKVSDNQYLLESMILRIKKLEKENLNLKYELSKYKQNYYDEDFDHEIGD